MIKNILVLILVVGFCFAQVYMIHLYFNSFMERKIKTCFYLIIAVLLMGVIKLLPSNVDVLIKTSAFILALIVIVYKSFQGTIAQKIYHTIFFSVIMMLSDLCLSFFVLSFSKLFSAYENSLIMTMIYFGFNFLSLLLSFIIVKILIHFKVDVDLALNNKEYFLLGIIPFCSLICIFGIERFNNLGMFECYLFLLIVNVCIMLFYYKLLRENLISQKYIIIKRENEYYQNCLSNQKDIIQFKHDLKNIMLNLDYCLRENKIEEAHTQISKLVDIENSSFEKISGYIPIDAILNNKLVICRNNHIHPKIDIQFPHDVNIGSIDISVILGNLLDNAIEATLRLKNPEERMIKIGIKYVSEKIIVKITNTCNEVKLDFSRNIVSSEKGIGRYGIGISSIKDRIKRLGGYCDFTYKHGHFHALVVIPLEGE